MSTVLLVCLHECGVFSAVVLNANVLVHLFECMGFSALACAWCFYCIYASGVFSALE